MNKFIIFFSTGGLGYCTLELLWRQETHWSMFVLGGICFYLLYLSFTHFKFLPIPVKAIIGGVIITAAELLTGLIVNVLFNWDVWNYSSVPFNFLGQICLPYSLLWILLSNLIALAFHRIEEYI